MAALGITYGLQVANILGVAQELVGAADMPIVLGFELFMQGAGGLIGGPIAGKFKKVAVAEMYSHLEQL